MENVILCIVFVIKDALTIYQILCLVCRDTMSFETPFRLTSTRTYMRNTVKWSKELSLSSSNCLNISLSRSVFTPLSQGNPCLPTRPQTVTITADNQTRPHILISRVFGCKMEFAVTSFCGSSDGEHPDRWLTQQFRAKTTHPYVCLLWWVRNLPHTHCWNLQDKLR